MPWWFAVIESRHDLQNPTSPEKIVELGRSLQLDASSTVLDIGSGRGGPALILAETFGCRVTCIEQSEEFIAAAKQRAADKGLDHLIEVIPGDASEVELGNERYDAALCLGASFVWGGLDGTLAVLIPSVRRRGYVAVGEVYWRTWPLPATYEPAEGQNFRTLGDTVAMLDSGGIRPVALIDASLDDWDRYESLHWATLIEWLDENPGDPDAERFRRQGDKYRDRYLRWDRDLMGWAIFVGRKA
jgi:SAM-dependent methyltransferase